MNEEEEKQESADWDELSSLRMSKRGQWQCNLTAALQVCIVLSLIAADNFDWRSDKRENCAYGCHCREWIIFQNIVTLLPVFTGTVCIESMLLINYPGQSYWLQSGKLIFRTHNRRLKT